MIHSDVQRASFVINSTLSIRVWGYCVSKGKRFLIYTLLILTGFMLKKFLFIYLATIGSSSGFFLPLFCLFSVCIYHLDIHAFFPQIISLNNALMYHSWSLSIVYFFYLLVTVNNNAVISLSACIHHLPTPNISPYFPNIYFTIYPLSPS